MKKYIGFLTVLASLLAFVNSCERWPGMEYQIEPKQLLIDDQLIFVDGFLQEGVQVYQGTPGDDSDPADMLAIPIRNGFGRELSFVFVDNSDTYGIRVKYDKFVTKNQGDRQYFHFNIEGTPKNVQDGKIPISFDVLDENGISLMGTITKPVNVWSGSIRRPSREMIPTVERPFIFHHAELNWVNQDHENEVNKVYLYDNMPIPSTSFKPSGSGINYNTSVNIHYNSILIANNAIAPEYTAYTEGYEKEQDVLTTIVPDKETLEAHPEWFVLSDGTQSDEWDNSKNVFMHGKNSKPIAVSMYDENAPLVTFGNNRSHQFSSLTWNMTTKSAKDPLGTFFGQPGRFKIYVKYINNDPANDFIQYFPTLPGTDEHGWVPYEFEVKPNPTPGFAPDPALDKADWQPTEEMPVKAIRGEIVRFQVPYTFQVDRANENETKLRIWFATLRKAGSSAPTAYSFKLNQSEGYTCGFKNSDVVSIAGEGSVFGGGTAAKKTNEVVHYFADPV
ncbi:MAG: hypothetical protein ACI395_03980, partial [Candidatus Cryptobacteroides sp.]